MAINGDEKMGKKSPKSGIIDPLAPKSRGYKQQQQQRQQLFNRKKTCATTGLQVLQKRVRIPL